eukprot:353149-Chlamydomonas_euryale.AAC.10
MHIVYRAANPSSALTKPGYFSMAPSLLWLLLYGSNRAGNSIPDGAASWVEQRPGCSSALGEASWMEQPPGRSSVLHFGCSIRNGASGMEQPP